MPIDFHFSIKKFLFNYKPDIAVIVESEIWPNLIINCRKNKIPIALIQASFSNKSLKRWSFFKSFFRSLLESFDIIIAQSKEEKNKLYKYAQIKAHDVYNLKDSSTKLEFKKSVVNRIKKEIKKNFIVLALSTHSGEEKNFT